MSLSSCIDKVVGLGAMMGWTSVAYASTTATDAALLASMAEPMTGLVVAGTTLARHFHDAGREDCAKSVQRVRRKVEADIEAWIEAERIGRSEIEGALAEFDALLKDIAPSGRELAADNLDPDLVARRLIKRLPSLSDLPDNAPARRVIATIVTISFQVILADDALYRKIEPAVMAEALRRFTDIDRKLTLINETLRRQFVDAETANERRHAEVMAAIARKTGVDPIHLKPLFDAVGADPNIPPDQFEAAIRAAVETLLARARDPVAPSNDAVAVDAAIAVARDMLSRLDADGAVNSLRAARQRQADARQDLARGEARLAEEEGDILAAAYRRDEAIEAYRAAISLDQSRYRLLLNIGNLFITVGNRKEAMTTFEKFMQIAKSRDDSRSVMLSCGSIGELKMSMGDVDSALNYLQKALDIAELNLLALPDDRRAKLDVATCLSKIGDAKKQLDFRLDAKVAYLKALHIRRDMLKSGNFDHDDIRNLFVISMKAADIHKELGEYESLFETLEYITKIDASIIFKNGYVFEISDLRASLWERVANIRFEVGDINGAISAHEQTLKIRKSIYDIDPENTYFAHCVSISNNNLGNLYVSQNNNDIGHVYFKNAIEIIEKILEYDPHHYRWLKDAISLNAKLAAMNDDSVVRYSKALRIAQDLQSSGRLAPTDSWMIDDLAQRLAAAQSGTRP